MEQSTGAAQLYCSEANLDKFKEDKPSAVHQQSFQVWKTGQGRRREEGHMIKIGLYTNTSLPQNTAKKKNTTALSAVKATNV